MYCIPTPDICKALGIPEGSITKLKKACYGLVEAPLESFLTVSEFFLEIGFVRLKSDRCCWVKYEGDVLIGMICGHVDDFLLAGNMQDPRWLQITKTI